MRTVTEGPTSPFDPGVRKRRTLDKPAIAMRLRASGRTPLINANQIYVGALNADETGRSNVGRVYVATFAAQQLPLGALENAAGSANDQFGAAIAADAIGIVVGVPQADLTLSDGTTTVANMGRLEPFVLDRLDLLFESGFEN